MALVDLHVHTTYSDGHNAPSEVVKMAVEHGVKIMAVTDHDNLGGLNEAIAAGKELGVTVIPGVEISTGFNGKMIHILGLGIPTSNDAFDHFLKLPFNFRKEAIIKKVEILNIVFIKDGKKPIDMEDFIRSQGRYFNREKAAEYLVANGYSSGSEAAFELVTGVKSGTSFPISPAEAIAAIHKAGGLAILAHPFAKSASLRRLDPSKAGQESLLKELVAAGLDGLEAYQSEHGPDEVALALELAKKYGLLASAGCDWHGAICDVPGDIADRKGYYPEHIGGLNVTTEMIAPLLGRLGVLVDKK